MMNLAHEMSDEINAKGLAKSESISIRAIGIPYAKLRAQGHPLFASQFDCNAPLSPEQIAILRPGKLQVNVPQKKTKSEAVAHPADIPMRPAQGQPNEVAPQGFEAKTGWRVRIFIWLAFTIVMGHSLLIWWDLAHLWKVPGMIGGGVVFAFILSGMVLMSEKSESMAEIRENMLWAVGLLESLAIVVHQAAFYRSAGEAYLAGLGLGYTWALAAVICCCSIAATIFYQKVISK